MEWVKTQEQLPEYYEVVKGLTLNQGELNIWIASDGETNFFTEWDSDQVFLTWEVREWRYLTGEEKLKLR